MITKKTKITKYYENYEILRKLRNITKKTKMLLKNHVIVIFYIVSVYFFRHAKNVFITFFLNIGKKLLIKPSFYREKVAYWCKKMVFFFRSFSFFSFIFLFFRSFSFFSFVFLYFVNFVFIRYLWITKIENALYSDVCARVN